MNVLTARLVNRSSRRKEAHSSRESKGLAGKSEPPYIGCYGIGVRLGI
jgi:hypothetical protein